MAMTAQRPLSLTALLTLGAEGHDKIAKLRTGMRTLLVADAGGQLRVETKGMSVEGS